MRTKEQIIAEICNKPGPQFPANMFFRKDSREAFVNAIDRKAMSKDPESSKYVGYYMYMHTGMDHGVVCDAFKHINTRNYSFVPVKENVDTFRVPSGQSY